MPNSKLWRKTCLLLLSAGLLLPAAAMPASANYTTGFDHPGVGYDHGTAKWKADNHIAPQSVDFSSETVGGMLKAIEEFDFAAFAKNHEDLPWLDELLGNEGVIPDDIQDEGGANTLFSRGSALFMKTQNPSMLGFVGDVFYADTLNQKSMYSVSLSSGAVKEDKAVRKNYPSHESQHYTSGNLTVQQKKFITYGNSAVTLLEYHNPTGQDMTVTVSVESPFATGADGDELVGSRVAAPLMIGTEGAEFVEAMSYVDVRLSGSGLTPQGTSLKGQITIPAGGTTEQKIVMGWLADEIPQSKADYKQYKEASSNDQAFTDQVKAYNSWWAETIPYIDIPDENVKKVIYYRWWCNRFNFLEANIPGNDWQFSMNMEGALGYNNGITVSVPWVLQDLKWLRDPVYAYGTWLSQGEYSENRNYKNNPGRPGIWTWDMMQNTSQVGWEAYKIYGGGPEILKKFAGFSANDVNGTLEHFKGKEKNLVYYNHGPITGNDGDTVSMHWKGGGNYARLDGSATTYGNAMAAAEMYKELGDTASSAEMKTIASNIQNSILKKMWYDKADFDGDGKKDTNGKGSFLHKKTVGAADEFVPWRDNNMFVFNFGVVPKQGEPGYNSKYLTQLKDYGDPDYYPLFPFFTADQNSIMKRVQAYVNGETDAYGTDQFAWCNFGNYINTIRSSLRYYPVKNINTAVYENLFDWGAWLHTVEPGNTDHLDSNEFFWLEDYFFGTNWTPQNPPNPSGDIVRSWIHHDTLGMMNYTVLEDMAGLQPRTDSKIELWPVGVSYDHFAVDNVRYHGSDLSVVWQDPAKYSKKSYYDGIPAGFSLFINGERVMTTNEMSHVIYNTTTGKVELPRNDVKGAVGDNSHTRILFERGTADPIAAASNSLLTDQERVVDLFNKAGVDIVHQGANLAAAEGTKITSTYIHPDSDVRRLADGSTIASTDHQTNTALFGGSPNKKDTVTFEFAGKQRVDNVKLYFYNDRLAGGYGTPQSFGLEYLGEDGVTWKPVQGQYRYPEYIASNYNNVEFPAVETTALRVHITHTPGLGTGLKELQIYDNGLNEVIPFPNQAPKVSVGDSIRAEQGELLTLQPVVKDDGLPNGILKYRWEKVSGAGEVEEVAALDEAVFKAKFLVPGSYVYKLTVSDGEQKTEVQVPIQVFIPTAEMKELIAAFEPKDSGKIIRNKEDFTEASWAALEAVITEAKALLADENYTADQIREMTARLKQTVQNLEYLNVALLATPTSLYTSPWESVNAVNDGYIPYTSGSIGKPEEETQYGNWNHEAASHWLLYSWDRPVSISASSIYFYDDGGGVKVPADYTLEYWDEGTGKFIPVANLQGKATAKHAFNQVTFQEVTTTKLRLNLIRQTSAWTGVKEWRVIGTASKAEKIISSVAPVSVDTTIGTPPKLPEQVQVQYKDSSTGSANVIWAEIPMGELTTAHVFTLQGKVEGTSIPATARITVKYDKTELKRAIDEAADPSVSETNYKGTPKQWEALARAIQEARRVYDQASSTEGDINQALNQLKDAFGALERITPAK